MARAEEVKAVQTEHQTKWLAGQLDELEVQILDRISQLTGEVAAFRQEISGLRRVLIGLLVAVVCSIIVIPVSLLWSAALT